MKNKLLIGGILIFALGSLAVFFYTEQAVRLFWGVRYGNQQNWAGINVKLTGDEFFFPIQKNGNSLIIADGKSKALVSLRKEAMTAVQLRVLLTQACKTGECDKMMERHYEIDGVGVTSFSYLESISNDSGPLLQQHVLVEGADVWLQYRGDEDQYEIHKPTIDAIARELAIKAKSAANNQRGARATGSVPTFRHELICPGRRWGLCRHSLPIGTATKLCSRPTQRPRLQW